MRRERLLGKIDKARNDLWLESMGGPALQPEQRDWAEPGLRMMKLLPDEELAEIIGRDPQSKLGRLAESVLKRRESWRTPAKSALLVSIVSLAGWALLRTL
jgi:hypothetical protein